ncbi:signal peptidase I [Salinibius halmophilus]|uniref:signal peptidase I n=1 Tax=Salinibius halmophilus TaxID=1853216 RepID=UPI001F27B6C3|nr:signal peptidase I [Salinibius halmophilus]
MLGIPSVIYTMVLLALLAFWLGATLFFAWQRITKASLALAGEQSHEQALAKLQEPKWLEGIGWAVIVLLVLAVFTGIREGNDLTLTLVVATIILGLVRLLDFLVLAKPRAKLAATTGNEQIQQAAKYGGKMLSWGRDYFLIIFIVLLIRSWVFEPFKIPSASMRPTLIEGDYLVVSRFSYGIYLPVLNYELFDIADPERGDVIVFTPPHDASRYIKRVVAVPGDTVRYDYQSKQLFVNGERVVRELVPGGSETLTMTREDGREQSANVLRYREQLGDVDHDIFINPGTTSAFTGISVFDANLRQLSRGVTVPQGKYFAMGDNRDASLDSRYWGFVDETMIAGRAEFKWMYWPSFFSLPQFHRVGAIE